MTKLKKISWPNKKKHCENCEKLPWKLVGCQGVEVIKKIVTKLENSNCEEKKQKTQIMTKFKNSNCDKTQKLKLWQNWKTELRPNTKILNVKKFKNSNCDKTIEKLNCDKTQNSNCDKTQKLKLRQNLKTQIVTKLKNPNCDKNKIKL